MSHIFDALQRSEKIPLGSGSPVLPAATDLLQQAEHRVVSKWALSPLLDSSQHREPSGPESVVEFPLTHPPFAPDKPSAVSETAKPESMEIFGPFQVINAVPTSFSRLVCLTDQESPAAEGFRLLGAELRHLRRDRPLQTVLITSSVPREGKSTTAANLACVLGRKTQQKTLLLEGDLRRSSISPMFGLTDRPGLSEYLDGQRWIAQCLYSIADMNLWIMPAGHRPSNVLDILQPDRLSVLMAQLSRWFEWIVIDSPPVLPLADTSIWMRLADGVLLVARQTVTEKRQLLKVLDLVDSKKLVGSVLNCSSSCPAGDYYCGSSACSPLSAGASQ